MTPRFRRALSQTLEWEGGDTTDTGGRTRFGISQRAYPTEDIPNLTVERAAELYHRDYWRPLGLDALASPDVAAKVFDVAVNLGLAGGVRTVQRALGLTGRAVAVDGKMGDITRAAIDSTPARQMLAAICVEQARHYERLIVRDPTRFGAYERGWMRRAAWVPRQETR
jgi:lysozyme family protein